jgi:hypothetical protein
MNKLQKGYEVGITNYTITITPYCTIIKLLLYVYKIVLLNICPFHIIMS